MKILFLDDQEVRAQTARAAAIGNNFEWVKTAREAIDKLKVGQYDLVCLDHDLEDQHYGGVIDKNTGQAVADHIASMVERPKVWIHSMNPTGRENMIRTLRDKAPILIIDVFSKEACAQILKA